MIKDIGKVKKLVIGESVNGIRNGYKVEYRKEVSYVQEISEGDNIVIQYDDLIYYFEDIYWSSDHIYREGIFNFYATDFKKLENEEELLKETM